MFDSKSTTKASSFILVKPQSNSSLSSLTESKTLSPRDSFSATTIVGRSGQDRILCSTDLNEKWFQLESTKQKLVLNATILKLQGLVSTKGFARTCGACVTIFVPGYLLQLGDTVAIDVATLSEGDGKEQPQSLTPSHRLPNNQRVIDRLAVTRAIGDSICVLDPLFRLDPDIIPIVANKTIILGSDALIDSKITKHEILELISGSDSTSAPLASRLANAIFVKARESVTIPDDTSVVCFNADLKEAVIGVVDGHGGNQVADAIVDYFCLLLNAEIDLHFFEDAFFQGLNKLNPKANEEKHCLREILVNFEGVKVESFASWEDFQIITSGVDAAVLSLCANEPLSGERTGSNQKQEKIDDAEAKVENLHDSKAVATLDNTMVIAPYSHFYGRFTCRIDGRIELLTKLTTDIKGTVEVKDPLVIDGVNPNQLFLEYVSLQLDKFKNYLRLKEGYQARVKTSFNISSSTSYHLETRPVRSNVSTTKATVYAAEYIPKDEIIVCTKQEQASSSSCCSCCSCCVIQ
jgi:serine/threonine protein phosphatase PrpC